MNERALAWLHKQSRKKNIAMYNALCRPNASEEEIKNIEDAIVIIEYLIAKVESEK